MKEEEIKKITTSMKGFKTSKDYNELYLLDSIKKLALIICNDLDIDINKYDPNISLKKFISSHNFESPDIIRINLDESITKLQEKKAKGANTIIMSSNMIKQTIEIDFE